MMEVVDPKSGGKECVAISIVDNLRSWYEYIFCVDSDTEEDSVTDTITTRKRRKWQGIKEYCTRSKETS